MKGCIVRLLPENIHYGLIQGLGIPPEALVLEVDEAMGAEEVLIEFSQPHEMLHDGGIEDMQCIRYWVDENLEILETPEDAPAKAPSPDPNGFIEAPVEAGYVEVRYNVRPDRAWGRPVNFIVDDLVR